MLQHVATSETLALVTSLASIAPRLVVCVPSAAPRSEYAEGFLTMLRDAGAALCRVWRRSNVNSARNEVTALAYHRHADRDLWLWVDDDEWCPLPELERALVGALERFGSALDHAVVGGVYAPKARGQANVIVQEPDWARVEGGLPLGEVGGYYPAEFVAGGAVFHGRELISDMYETIEPTYYGRCDELRGAICWENVRRENRRGLPRESGEDVGFSLNAIHFGYELWLDTRWVMRHEGTATFVPGDSLQRPEVTDHYPRPASAPEFRGDHAY